MTKVSDIKISPMPVPDPTVSILDRPAIQKDQTRYFNEQLVRSQEIGIIRDKLKWCYRREGVNHLKNCRELSVLYIDMIGDLKGGWFKGYQQPVKGNNENNENIDE
jgi:NADH dehydrogenase (ubiquinone) 1 beta subcomplex subunit 10